MARGWESKAIESQIEEAQEQRRAVFEPRTPEELALQGEKESLELSRKRVVHDLEEAKNPRYRKILTEALAHLDAKLASL